MRSLLTERKKTILSNYGYENVVDYLNLETDTLKKAQFQLR